MGNKEDISKEPETKELKRMIWDGELDPGRTVKHLKEADDKQRESNKAVVDLEVCPDGKWEKDSKGYPIKTDETLKGL